MEPGVISTYLERLSRELDFDRALAQRVRREVEDHLREAVEADPAGGPEAERRAVANFGDARAIAIQFATMSLARRARRLGVTAVLVIAAAFVAMKARLTWYAVVQWPGIHGMETLREVVGAIDRYAFWMSVAAGLAAWLYIDSRRIPAAFTPGYSRQLRRFFLLSSAAACALIASVVCDGVLTSLRLAGAGWSLESLIPVLSMAIEIASAGILIGRLRGMTPRIVSTASWRGGTGA
jgi:HAAS